MGCVFSLTPLLFSPWDPSSMDLVTSSPFRPWCLICGWLLERQQKNTPKSSALQKLSNPPHLPSLKESGHFGRTASNSTNKLVLDCSSLWKLKRGTQKNEHVDNLEAALQQPALRPRIHEIPGHARCPVKGRPLPRHLPQKG